MKKQVLSLLLAVAVCAISAMPALAYDAQTNTGAGTVCAAKDVTFVVKKDGSLWGWGNNSYGQLGNGHTGDKILNEYSVFQSVPIKLLDGVKSVATDGDTVLVVKNDGSLWGWGSNRGAQLGAETIGGKHLGDQWTPVQIMNGVKTAYMGVGVSYAIKSDDTLWGWGRNNGNQLGNKYQGNKLDPNSSGDPRYLQTTPIKLMDNVRMVSGNIGIDSVTMAVKNDNSLWAWTGVFFEGLGSLDLGNIDGDGNRCTAQVPLKIMEDISSVSVGYHGQVLAVKTDGSLWGWGNNRWGQLGNGGAYIRPQGYPVMMNESGERITCIQLAPVKLMDGGVKAVYTGGGSPAIPGAGMTAFSAVLKTDGSLWMCGDARYGTLLNGATGNVTLQPYHFNNEAVDVLCQDTFVKVMDKVASVACGDYHTAVAKTDGTVWAGGANYCAQLGDGLKTATKSADGVTAALTPVKIDMVLF